MSATDFRTSGYFSWTMVFVGIILVPVGLAALVKSAIVGLLILFVSLTIFTTHYRLNIDLTTKVFHDYLWVLGMKFGEKRIFGSIECLFIKKKKVSQIMNHMAGSSTIRKEIYSGYLKFSDLESIHLTTRDRKEALIRILKGISGKLKTKTIDYSDGDPKEL